VETNEKKGTFLLNVREEGEVCISKLVSGMFFFDKFKPNISLVCLQVYLHIFKITAPKIMFFRLD
jgi:ubiquitin-protein ligase